MGEADFHLALPLMLLVLKVMIMTFNLKEEMNGKSSIVDVVRRTNAE